MSSKLDHLTHQKIEEKKDGISNSYQIINEIIEKWYKGEELNQKDKENYYTNLGTIRYQKWNLREKILKRDCRKLFQGLFRSVILDGDIEIKGSYLNKVLTPRELRKRIDEIYDDFRKRSELS